MKDTVRTGGCRAAIKGCAAGFRYSLAILVIGLLPGLLVAQVPRPGDDRPELPDFVEGEAATSWSLPTIVAQVDAARAGDVEDAGSVAGEPQSAYVVQVGAFADSANAARLLTDLEASGHKGTIQRTANADGVELAQVMVGPFATRDAALEAQAALAADGWTGYVHAEPAVVERAVVVAATAAEASPAMAPKVATHDAWTLPATGASGGDSNIVTTPRVQVSGFRFRGNTAFSDEELWELTSAYTNRPISFEELLRLRDELTLHYVSHGYVTSGVLLPEQVVSDGIIEFQVVEGTLAAINVSEAERLRPGYVERRLRADESEVVNMTTLEGRLQVLQQDPLIHHVEAQLVPGPRRELSELNLRVFERRPFGGSFEVNNHQAPSIGSERAMARFWHRNLSGGGDSFNITASGSEGLGEVEASYEIPLNSRGTRLGFWAIATRAEAVEAPFDQLDIESETESYAIDFTHPFIRNLNTELSIFGSAEVRQSQSFLFGEGFQFSEGLEEDGIARVTVLRLGVQYTHRDRQRVFAARSTFSGGIDAFDATINESGPSGEFFAWLAQLQWAQRFDWLDMRMIARLDAQLALDPLLPLEQFAVGGHATVRGYRENRFVRDNGVVASLEFRIPIWRRASGRSVLELAPFYDYGRATNRDRPTPQPEVLESAGLGLIAPISAMFYGEVFWGHALRDVPDISDEHNLQDDGIHFRFRLVFE
jgi:hemolysin activation/secretion protein